MKVAGRCANTPGRGQPLVRGVDVGNVTCPKCGRTMVGGGAVTHIRGCGRLCEVEGCARPHFVHGECRMHAARIRPLPREVLASHEDRFWPKVDKNGPIPEHRPDLGPCWLWTGTLTTHRYGEFNMGMWDWGAHRWSYIVCVGPIPDGHEIDHLCRVRHCVRPDHLEAVTHLENMVRIPAEVLRDKAARAVATKRRMSTGEVTE